MGCLEELSRYVRIIADICKENDLNCFIDIEHDSKEEKFTSVDFEYNI